MMEALVSSVRLAVALDALRALPSGGPLDRTGTRERCAAFAAAIEADYRARNLEVLARLTGVAKR